MLRRLLRLAELDYAHVLCCQLSRLMLEFDQEHSVLKDLLLVAVVLPNAQGTHNSPMFHHPKSSCDVVKYASDYVQMKGYNPYLTPTKPAAK